MISNPKGQNRNMLYRFLNAFVFATSNKREITDKQEIERDK